MPSRAKRLGCDRVAKAKERFRGNAHERGYTRQWRKARLRYLKGHPLCRVCLAAGRVVAATDVDHIVPHRGDPLLFWKMSNWQSLCKRCHSEKTQRGQ